MGIYINLLIEDRFEKGEESVMTLIARMNKRLAKLLSYTDIQQSHLYISSTDLPTELTKKDSNWHTSNGKLVACQANTRFSNSHAQNMPISKSLNSIKYKYIKISRFCER